MEFNEKELLDFVLKNDIINVEATLEKMELMERREILALHPIKLQKDQIIMRLTSLVQMENANTESVILGKK